ncbi:Uncharacterised protein [uncultured archaeon]|nr:Uncharacterised protein [uncultured archaeon]
MGLFGKRDKFVDLSEGYSRKSSMRKTARPTPQVEEDNFLGSIANSNTSTSSEVSWDNDSPQQETFPDKKQKLAKRLFDMTEKMEDLSNQVYHLKQRVELLEKKLKINFE